MAQNLRLNATDVTQVNWSTFWEAMHVGGAFAYTATTADADELFGFDASALPDTLTIEGISINLKAWKDESAGSGTMSLRVQLSWDNGTTWTTAKESSSLSTTLDEYTLGGATDDWSHTWTRAQLQAGTFRVRVISHGTVVDVPEWSLDHVELVLYYADISELTYAHEERLKLADSSTESTLVYHHTERLQVRDAGSSRVPITQHLALTGTAITANQSSPLTPWQEACESNKRKESFGATLSLSSTGPLLGLGDAVSQDIFGGTQGLLGWALLDMSDIDRAGNYGESQRDETCVLSVRVGALADITATGEKPIDEWLQSKSAIGQTVTAYAFVDGGNGWQQRIVFSGVIDYVEAVDDRLDINCLFVGRGLIKVPDIFVDSDSFDYEETTEDTGLPVERSEGKPVPIGFGRFDMSAVIPDADLPTGHPLKAGTLNGYDGNSALWGAMFGIRHPVMPTIAAARKWRRTINSQLSWGFHSVFLHGSKKSVPVLDVITSPIPSSTNWRTVPGYGTGGSTPWNYYGTWFRKNIFTWSRTADDNALSPFLQDILTSMHQGVLPGWHSAGDMREYASGSFSDGTADDAFGIFVNNHRPPGFITDSAPAWQGAVQSIALPLKGLTLTGDHRTTDGVAYHTDDTVDDATGCVDLKDMLRVTRVHAGERISLRLPASSNNLGKQCAVRVCFLVNPDSTTATYLWMNARNSPSESVLLNNAAGVLNPNFSDDHMCERQTTPGLYGSQRADMGNGFVFGSFIISPFFSFDHWVEHQRFAAGHEAAWRKGFHSPWNFTGLGLTGVPEIPELYYQGDVVFWVDASETGKHVDIVAAWMEVNYVSKMNDGVDTLPDTSGDVDFRTITRDGVGPLTGLTQPIIGRTQVSLASNAETSIRTSAGTSIWLTGRGPYDDSVGTFTGGDETTVIENPSDIAGAIIRHYAGLSAFNQRATGSDFGSFIAARTALADVLHTVTVDRALVLPEVLASIGANSMSFTQEQLDDSGVRQYRTFVDGEDPETNQPERMYRGDGYGFTWDKIRTESFSAVSTDLRTIANDIKVEYGFFGPDGKPIGTSYVNHENSNFETDAAAYIAACSVSKQSYKFSKSFSIRLPFVYRKAVAEIFTKYFCDSLRERREVVEFVTYANGLDLQAGHIIKFSDSIATTGIKKAWKGLGSSAWSDHQFDVIEVSQAKDAPEPFAVRVLCVETFTAAA